MATQSQISTFIATMVPIAVRQAAKHNNKIFPSVCIAQACTESGYGTSTKMKKANAVFGVKVGKSAYHFGTAWKDKAYSTQTKECYDGKTYSQITDMFRAYSTLEDSVEDYMDMLCTCQRYKSALNCNSAKESISAIKAGGYATDPDYVSKILWVINEYGLGQYDAGVSGASTQTEEYVRGCVYTLQSDLYVRDNADGVKLKYEALTIDAKNHGKFDEFGCAILTKGTRVTCIDIEKLPESTWLRIPSGWVCAKAKGIRYIV